MLSYGFGDPIAGFANPHNESWRDTPHLTTPSSFGGSSSRGAFTFASRGHRALTTATHGTRTVGGRTLFLYLFFCLRRPGTSSTATATASSSTWGSWWSWAGCAGGRAAHRRTTPLFVDSGHCIGMRDVANPSASSPFLSIFIEQIQPSP